MSGLGFWGFSHRKPSPAQGEGQEPGAQWGGRGSSVPSETRRVPAPPRAAPSLGDKRLVSKDARPACGQHRRAVSSRPV